jgi:hypothetical protein
MVNPMAALDDMEDSAEGLKMDLWSHSGTDDNGGLEQ